MFGQEAKEIADRFDITPVLARKWMVARDNYPMMDKSHTFLDVTEGLDSWIIDAMGWLPGGDETNAVLPHRPVPVPVGGVHA